jgi:hypothetical protein
MRMPKLPPNAADYGVRDNMFNIGVDMPDIDTELLDYDAETIRQFAACMEAGWRRHTEILIATKPTCVTCRLFNRCSRGVVTCTYEDRIMAAAKYTKRWAEWSEKHAPTTETP